MDNKEEQELAKFFHDVYERLAPQHGYETREDTKQFDPKSPNGQLMTAVAKVVIKEYIHKAEIKAELRTLESNTHTHAIIKHNQELIDYYAGWRRRKSIKIVELENDVKELQYQLLEKSKNNEQAI